jgi:hypothetical protein
MSAKIYLRRSGLVVVAADKMTQHDAVKTTNVSQETRQFVKLAVTLREPLAANEQQMLFTSNYDDLLDASTKKAGRRRIVRPPGSKLLSFADIFCSSKTIERVIIPNISDMRIDYCNALAEKKNTKAVFVRIRGYWSFWKALGLHTLIQNIVEIWKASRLG